LASASVAPSPEARTIEFVALLLSINVTWWELGSPLVDDFACGVGVLEQPPKAKNAKKIKIICFIEIL
jgi:hypothetical protein